jgi:hypothetical protein
MGKMSDAYDAAGRGYRAVLYQRAPVDAERLDRLQRSDLLVVLGCYDHAERVLRALDLQHRTVPAELVSQLTLRPSQTVLVNCPGKLDLPALEVIRSFVFAGGRLVTTDWALPNLIERTFPGYIEYSGRPTADDVVSVEITDTGKAFVDGLLDPKDEPRWWLEASSHPIRVLDPKGVDVLITSREMGQRYGEPAIAVRFRAGKGTIYHVVSHYYLQRTDTRTERQRGKAGDWLMGKGVTLYQSAVKDGQLAGEVEAAWASVGFLGKVLATRDGDGNADGEADRDGGGEAGRCRDLRGDGGGDAGGDTDGDTDGDTGGQATPRLDGGGGVA